jgi:hypothetical protein
MKENRSIQQAHSSPNNQQKSEGQENKEDEIFSLKKKRKEDDASKEMEEVDGERYSTPYFVKIGLSTILMNNEEVIAEIERKSKKLTRASIRISLFLILFVLSCLENNKHIPKLNSSFIQCVCTALFGKIKNPKINRRDMLNKVANMDDAYKALEYQFTHL